VIEIGEGVELHRLVAPLALYARAKLAGKPNGLADIPADDFLILIHRRDPLGEKSERPFGAGEAPERPDHDIESWSSRVLDLRRSCRRKSTRADALRPRA
jgi:hypothetical protein